jgi:hypothetical protein
MGGSAETSTSTAAGATATTKVAAAAKSTTTTTTVRTSPHYGSGQDRCDANCQGNYLFYFHISNSSAPRFVAMTRPPDFVLPPKVY